MTIMNSAHRQIQIWAFVTVLAVSLLVYFYSKDTTLGNDELVYCYVMEMGRTGSAYYELDSLSRHVETFGDVIESQVDHWQYLSGRTIPHVIEQTFSGVLPIWLFYVLNAIVFYLTIIAIVYLGTGRLDCSPYLWLIAIVFFIYLMPDPMLLVTSINRSPNYLWATLMTCGFLILWDKSLTAPAPHTAYKTILLAAYALIAAWNHEVFTIPLCAALAIYCLVQFYKHDISRMSTDTWALTLGYFIGSILLLASPGNIARVLGGSASHGGITLGNVSTSHLLIFKIEDLFSCVQTYVFLAVFVLAFILHKDKLKTFVRSNALLMLCFAMSLPWAIAVNTGRPMTGFVVFGCLVVIRLAYWLFRIPSISSARGLIMPSALACIIITHLIFVDIAQAKYNTYTRNVIEDFIASPDGIVSLPPMDESPLVKPYLRPYNFVLNPGEISRVYGDNRKFPTYLSPSTYRALSKPEIYFTDSYRYPGNSDFCYFGDEYIWSTEKPEDPANLVWEYYPVSFSDPNISLSVRLKRLLIPSAYSQTELNSDLDSLYTRWGTYYRIMLPKARRAKAIDTVQTTSLGNTDVRKAAGAE